MRAGHGVRGTLGKALAAGGAANGIGRFLHQQRLVTVQGVEAFQPFLQMGGELVRG